MKFLVLLAIKNLFRYRRRTLITSVVIAVGLMMFLIIDSLLVGIDRESVRNLKWYETASIQIMHPEFWEDRMLKPLDSAIINPHEILETLENSGYTATVRTQFSADLILSSIDFPEDGNLPVHVTAVDVNRDSQVFRLDNHILEGRFPVMGTNEVVIGSWLAEDIHAEVGYWITLVTRGNGGFYEAIDMKIVGIVNCPNPNINRSLLLVPIDTISDYLAMTNLATEIDIALPETAQIEHQKLLIQSLIHEMEQPLVVKSWDEIAGDYVSMISMERKGSSIILFLVFLIAAVGISNTMIMVISERIRELGMMRALGMSDRSIHLLFLLEATGIGVLGSIFGTAAGLLINIYLVMEGINFGFLMRTMDMAYRIQSIFRGSWHIQGILITFISGIVLSVVVAWFPTKRATNKDIPSCLRHQ